MHNFTYVELLCCCYTTRLPSQRATDTSNVFHKLPGILYKLMADRFTFPSLSFMIYDYSGDRHYRTRDSICNDVCAERCLKITSCFIVLGLIYCFCIAFRTIQPNYFNSRFKSCECNPTPTLRLVSLEERTTTSFSLMCLLNFCNSPQL